MPSNQPTPPASQTPPDVPPISIQHQPLSAYLQRFSLWAFNRLAGKLNANTALPGILLQAYDAPAGTNPAVWKLVVSPTGALSTMSVPLGSGRP